MAMWARRDWAAVVAMPPRGRTGRFSPERRRGAIVGVPADTPNTRYVSPSAGLDANRTSPRFVAPTSIEAWREKMRQDDAMRAVLLNRAGPQPCEG